MNFVHWLLLGTVQVQPGLVSLVLRCFRYKRHLCISDCVLLIDLLICCTCWVATVVFTFRAFVQRVVAVVCATVAVVGGMCYCGCSR